MQETKLLNTILQAYQLREQNQHAKAMQLAKRCLRELPQNPEVHCLWGLLLMDAKKYQEACKAINTAISINPSKSDYYFFLGEIHSAQKNYSHAENAYKECIKRSENNYLAYGHLGQALKCQNKKNLAIKNYSIAVDLNAKYFKGFIELGELYHLTGDRISALDAYQKALALNPNHVNTLSNVGALLFYENQYDMAIKFLRKAVCLNGENIQVLNNLSAVYLESHDYENALKYIRQLIKLNPNHLPSWWHLAICKTFEKPDDPDIFQMQALLKSLAKNVAKEYLFFALGKAFDDLKDYKTAIEYFHHGNDLVSKKHPFNLTAYKTVISKIINSFDQTKLKRLPVSEEHTIEPLFIVGLSRSGKSLLEKALSYHDEIAIAGEIGINHVIETAHFENKPAGNYPYWLKSLNKVEMQEISHAYYERLQRDVPKSTKYVIDTLPTNFLYLGLIQLLFPNAKIIRCVREAKDNCLSIYTKLYSNSNYYSYDLNVLAGYYREYQRLMQYWDEKLDKPYLTIQYEDFVTNSKSVLKTVCEYLELPAIEQVNDLSLHHNEINRWKNYKYYIKPLIHGLTVDESSLNENEIIFDKNQKELIEHYLRQGQYARGIKLVNNMIKDEPNDAGLYYSLGRLYFAEHKLKEAEAALLKSIELNGLFYLSYFELSQVYNDLQNKIKADKFDKEGKAVYHKSLEKKESLQPEEKQRLVDALNNHAPITLEHEKKLLVKGAVSDDQTIDSFMTKSWDAYFEDLSHARFRDVYQKNEKRWYMRAWHFLFKNVALVDKIMRTNQKHVYILDIGCSTGYLRKIIEGNVDKNSKPEVYYWGLDVREDILKQAIQGTNDPESGAQGNTVPTLYIEHDVKYPLPFHSEYFDMVVNFEMIKYLPIEQGKALFKEIHRVLKPGGMLFFSTTYNSAYPGFMQSVPYEQLEIMLKRTGFELQQRRGSQSSIYKIAKQVKKPHAPLVQDLLKVHPPEIVGAILTPLYPELSSQVTFYCKKN